MSRAPQPRQELPPDQREAARQQIIINTRLTALQAAQDIIKVSNVGLVKATALVEEAKVIEAYILDGIDAVKPKSALIVQSQMPPPGAFKPGD